MEVNKRNLEWTNSLSKELTPYLNKHFETRNDINCDLNEKRFRSSKLI